MWVQTMMVCFTPREIINESACGNGYWVCCGDNHYSISNLEIQGEILNNESVYYTIKSDEAQGKIS